MLNSFIEEHAWLNGAAHANDSAIRSMNAVVHLVLCPHCLHFFFDYIAAISGMSARHCRCPWLFNRTAVPGQPTHKHTHSSSITASGVVSRSRCLKHNQHTRKGTKNIVGFGLKALKEGRARRFCSCQFAKFALLS